MDKKIVRSTAAPAAIGPYSQAVIVGTTMYLSGQIALDPASGNFLDGDVRAQTARVLQNLGAVLASAGLTFAHVVKTTIYLIDMNDFQAVNEIYARTFAAAPPARATIAVAALPRGARVEIEAVAAVPKRA